MISFTSCLVFPWWHQRKGLTSTTLNLPKFSKTQSCLVLWTNHKHGAYIKSIWLSRRKPAAAPNTRRNCAPCEPQTEYLDQRQLLFRSWLKFAPLLSSGASRFKSHQFVSQVLLSKAQTNGKPKYRGHVNAGPRSASTAVTFATLTTQITAVVQSRPQASTNCVRFAFMSSPTTITRMASAYYPPDFAFPRHWVVPPKLVDANESKRLMSIAALRQHRSNLMCVNEEGKMIPSVLGSSENSQRMPHPLPHLR